MADLNLKASTFLHPVEFLTDYGRGRLAVSYIGVILAQIEKQELVAPN